MLNLDHEQSIAEAMLSLAGNGVREAMRLAYFRGWRDGQIEGMANREEFAKDFRIDELWMIYGGER